MGAANLQQQSLQSSIINFAAQALGAVNLLFIYPKYLTKMQLGLFRFLVDNAQLFAVITTLGVTSVILRYFPYFTNPNNKHHGFGALASLTALSGNILFCLLTLFFYEPIVQAVAQEEQEPLARVYFQWIIPLVFAMSFANVFQVLCQSIVRISFPNLLVNLVTKLPTALFAVLCGMKLINFWEMIMGTVVSYLLVTTTLGFYAWKQGLLGWRIHFSFWKTNLNKELGIYALFSFLGSTGSLLVTQIDRIMIPALAPEGFADSAVFAIGSFMALVILIPYRTVIQALASVVSRGMKKKQYQAIGKIYKRTSTTQLFIAIFLLLNIVLAADDLFRLMPNGDKYRGAEVIIWLMGAAYLVEVATSINNHIISYSHFYKYTLVLLVCLVVINIALNYYFMGVINMGTRGAALATLVSFTLYNVIQMGIVYIKLRIHPFSKNMLRLIPVSVLAFGVLGVGYNYLIQLSPIPNILLRNSLFSLAFLGMGWLLKVEGGVINTMLNKLKNHI